jgi:hypothetical protein
MTLTPEQKPLLKQVAAGRVIHRLMTDRQSAMSFAKVIALYPFV